MKDWKNKKIIGLDTDEDLSKYSLKSISSKENAICSRDIISEKAKNRWGDDEKRFWKFVDKKNDDECWNTSKKEILLKDGRRISYQRFSLELYGKKSKKQCVGHYCNNKKCVNPKHLYYATREEHSSKIPKNPLKGEKNNKAKLKTFDVKSIKDEYNKLVKKFNKTYGIATILAKKYNVTSATIGNIIKGKTWK